MKYTIQAEYGYVKNSPKEHLIFSFETVEDFSSKSFTRALRHEFQAEYTHFYDRAKSAKTFVAVYHRGSEDPVRVLSLG